MATSTLSLVRVSGTRPKINKQWLNPNDVAERTFGECFNIINSDKEPNERYKKYLTNIDPNRHDGAHYLMSYGLDDALKKAAEALHHFFLVETERAIASDDLLQRCGIPPEYWARLRESWATQPQTVAGRFDILFDGTNLACVEYNADSASTILECGQLQQKTAVALGIDKDSVSSGARLAPLVQEAWRASGASGRVHFCVENDGEEEYTAQFVMECARAAGLDPRLCVMFDDFKFTAEGGIVDREGIPVRYVWKTWMWESAIADDQKARAERGAGWRPSPGEQVRLCDILFHPAIRYFEPFWKVIMSNKALLPMVYESNRGHPNVLPAAFTLTPELQRSGFARKPVVGRVGENIQLVDGTGASVSESTGRFSARDVVYQQLASNPARDGYYATLGVWVVNGKYGGVGMREDDNPITGPFSQYGMIRIQSGGEASA